MEEAHTHSLAWRALHARLRSGARFIAPDDAPVRVALLLENAQAADALALLENLEGRAGSFDVTLQRLHTACRAQLGDIDRARDLFASLPAIGVPATVPILAHLIYAADGERWHDPARERAIVGGALAYARMSSDDALLAMALLEASFSAWLHGDDIDAARHDRELAAIVDDGEFYALDLYRRCALQEPTRDDAVALPRARVYAFMRATERCGKDERSAFARLALDAARSTAIPSLIRLARLVSDAVHGDLNGNAPFRRLSALAALEEAGAKSPLAWSLQCARCSVTVRDRTIELAPREFTVLALLALRPGGMSVRDLAGALWPDDDRGGKNAVQAHVSRIRRRLDLRRAIVSTAVGYRLDPAASVDLWTWRTLLTDVGTRALYPSERLRVREAYDALRGWRDCALPDPAFESVARALCDMEHEIALSLGRDAIAREDWHALLAVGSTMQQGDRCDEHGCEFVMRARLALGDRASAHRAYRQLRTALDADLGVEPSHILLALLPTV